MASQGINSSLEDIFSASLKTWGILPNIDIETPKSELHREEVNQQLSSQHS